MTDMRTGKWLRSGGLGCPDREAAAPRKHSIYYAEWNREVGLFHTLTKEVGLVHTDKQGGGVYAVRLDQGYRFS